MNEKKTHSFKHYCTLALFLLTGLLSSEKLLSQQVTFRHLTIDDGLSQNAVFSILKDSRGFMWFGTKDGLNRYDGRNFVVFKHNPFDPSSISDAFVMQLYEDRNGRIWTGSITGDVNIFQRETESFCNIPLKNEAGEKVITNEITAIAEGPDGNIWIGTKGDGLIKILLDAETNCHFDFRQFLHDPADGQSLSSNLVANLLIDENETLWVGTENGLNQFHETRASFSLTVFETRNPEAAMMPGIQKICSMLESSTGVFWIGTLSGLVKFDRDTKDYSYYPNRYELFRYSWGSVNRIVEDQMGLLWLGTAAGLMHFDPSSHYYTYYQHDPLNSRSLSYDIISSLSIDETGILWVGTAGHGINFLDFKSNRFKSLARPVDPSSRITGFSIRSILEDNSGDLWISADVLYRWNRITGELKSFESSSDRPDDFGNTDAYSMIQASDGLLWFASPRGLFKFDPVTNQNTLYKHTPDNEAGLVKQELNAVFEARDSTIWIATHNYFSRLTDEHGNLWLSTNKGLSRFNPETGSFRNFDALDGLQSNEFNTGAFLKSKSGEMFFGGIQGLNYFFPNQIHDNPHIPPVVLTDLRIGNRYVSHKTDSGLLEKSLPEVKEIFLSHKDDIITFEFAALDFSAPEKNRYRYKLEGYNESWIDAGNLGTATYTNLPHGKFTFRVKGSNNDGLWNEEGMAIAVAVTPPWSQSWWAYIIYALLFLNGLYLLRRYELSRFNLKNQLAFEKVESESLRNLDQLKSHFFTNISHEFRTPLTLITGQIETLLESEEDSNRKKKLVSVNRNAEQLLALINQLLDLSKLEAGKMELYPEEHNLVSFLKNQLFSFESLAGAKNIILSFSSSRAAIPVHFDAEKMEKVFVNLFSNAVKFSEAGGRVDVSVDIPGPDVVEIRIKDCGIGIPKDRLPYIFDRFYQADPSNTRKYEGTGIGLAQAHELIALHNGTIEAKSKEGDGSEFFIRLPFEGGNDSIGNESTFKEQLSVEAESFREKLPDFESLLSEHDEIILIVEDNADVRAFISEQLRDEYNILEASDGREGIAVSQETIPDLIITDLMMPVMDGCELSLNIRKDEKTSHIPIIMLTAKAGLDPRIEGLESGIDAFLNKPFHVKELLTTVRTLIQQRKNLKKQYSSTTYFKPSVISKSSVDQRFLSRAIEVFENHIDEEHFKVEDYAESLGMSISQLNRKLNALVGQSAGNFIRSLRLQRAAELLNQTNKTIAQTCYEVGFNDQAYFSRAFKKQFGKSPSAFRKISI